MSDAGAAASAEAVALPPSECKVTLRGATLHDCAWLHKVFVAGGYCTYDGPCDGPSEEHWRNTWIGRWAARVADSAQCFTVAVTERFEGAPEVIGFARFWHKRKGSGVLASHVSSLALEGSASPHDGHVGDVEDVVAFPHFELELMSLFVVPEFRGFGVGTRLLETGLAAALAAYPGVEREQVFCWSVGNAVDFYEARGGVVVGKHEKKDEGTTTFAVDLGRVPTA